MIREKTTEDLRHMTDEEGLILQGCGGDLQEWVDGINELLTQEGILLNGSKFENAATFQHDGLTNLLFSFEGVQLNVGKLAMWRIQTHSTTARLAGIRFPFPMRRAPCCWPFTPCSPPRCRYLETAGPTVLGPAPPASVPTKPLKL